MIINMIYRQLYDTRGEKIMIGGVETYISNLIFVFTHSGHEVFIYQFSEIPFNKQYMGATVIGVCPKNKLEHMYKMRIRCMVNESYKHSDPDKDILLFCTENDIIKSRYKKVIAIQHGIGWDVHNLHQDNWIMRVKYWLTNSKRAFKEYSQFKNCKTIVCVDYNFVNWYRTMIHDNAFNYKVIPNFSEIPDYEKREHSETVSVIFARRFQTYRGTRIFAGAMENILQRYNNVEVTIAGDGPEESYLHSIFDKYKNVCFTRFMPEESISVHLKYDIAVVPSTASEGTSLSLIEAMAAGCAVVSTDIGGLTNIILDGYNGIIVRPQIDELFYALELIICNDKLREKLARNGYETVKDSFGIKQWEQKWMAVINSIK